MPHHDCCYMEGGRGCLKDSVRDKTQANWAKSPKNKPLSTTPNPTR